VILKESERKKCDILTHNESGKTYEELKTYEL